MSPRPPRRAKGPPLPGKHSTTLPLRRYSFIAAAATLLIVLVSWVAVRAVGPAEADQRTPLMVQPTVPLTGTSEPPSSAPSPSASPSTTSASPSPSPSRSRSATPTAAARTPTKTVTPRKTTAAPTPTSFAAQYRLASTWDRGFIAGVTVTNKSGPARAWTIRLSYAEEAGVRLGNVWNAQQSREGDTFVLTGGPLAPGASIMVGFQASKQVKSQIKVASCTVDGAPCAIG